MHTLLRYLGTVAAVILTMHLVPGIAAPGGWLSIFLLALVWSAITLVMKPVLSLLTLPITIVTLGLFSLLINALLFWLASALVPGFTVAGFWSAFLGAILLAVFNWLIHFVIPE